MHCDLDFYIKQPTREPVLNSIIEYRKEKPAQAEESTLSLQSPIMIPENGRGLMPTSSAMLRLLTLAAIRGLIMLPLLLTFLIIISTLLCPLATVVTGRLIMLPVLGVFLFIVLAMLYPVIAVTGRFIVLPLLVISLIILLTILAFSMTAPFVIVFMAPTSLNFPLVIADPKFRAIRSPGPAGLANRNTACSTLPEFAAVNLIRPRGSNIAFVFVLPSPTGVHPIALLPAMVTLLVATPMTLVVFLITSVAVVAPLLLPAPVMTVAVVVMTSRNLPLIVTNTGMRVVRGAMPADLADGDSTGSAFVEAVAVFPVSPGFSDVAPAAGGCGDGWNKQGRGEGAEACQSRVE
jgi:hypothetical protein